jgi:Kef-type K+ transport system membrane component KefB/mannitol/fructose-specific phosphotransferase system IIA component (Ntr-type)
MAGAVAVTLDHNAQISLFTSLTVLLGLARLLGELARFVHQPAVLGEIVAGILLGQTVLGKIWKTGYDFLFRKGSAGFIAVQGVAALAVTLFMLVAGIEMSFKDVVKRRNQSLIVAAAGIIVPLGSGMLLTYFGFRHFDPPPGVNRVHFALVIGVAMSITALPVVAKTLRDLHLYHTDMGITVMAAATVNDLIGWSLFAIALSLSGRSEGGPHLAISLVFSVLFVVLMLTVGRWVFDLLLPPLQAYLTWPGGVLGFIGFSGLASASFALYIGLHNTLGAFMTGAALGDSKHLRHRTRNMLDMFVSYLFVPIYFASVAISIDFVKDFSAVIVFSILIVACAGKLIGAYVGARVARIGHREAVAIAVCMNSRGAIEIILANVALQYNLISQKLFVALVFMAIITSMLPGPLLRLIIGSPNPSTFTAYMSPRAFVRKLSAVTAEAAIAELCSRIGMEQYCHAVYEEELTTSSGKDNRTAIPCAAVSGLSAPRVAIGISQDGIDFQSPSGVSAQVIILVLTPSSDLDAQHDLLRDIDSFTESREFLDEIKVAHTVTEVFALVQVKRGERTPTSPVQV